MSEKSSIGESFEIFIILIGIAIATRSSPNRARTASRARPTPVTPRVCVRACVCARAHRMYTYVHHCPTLLTPSHVRPKETSAGDARRGVVLARDAPDVGRRRGSRVGRVWVVDTTHTWVQSRVMTQKNYPTHLTDDHTITHRSRKHRSIDRPTLARALERANERSIDRDERAIEPGHRSGSHAKATTRRSMCASIEPGHRSTASIETRESRSRGCTDDDRRDRAGGSCA